MPVTSTVSKGRSGDIRIPLLDAFNHALDESISQNGSKVESENDDMLYAFPIAH